MSQIALQFRCILEMVEFQNITNTFTCTTDPEKLLLVCTLPDDAIELAKKGYDAKVVEVHAVKSS